MVRPAGGKGIYQVVHVRMDGTGKLLLSYVRRYSNDGWVEVARGSEAAMEAAYRGLSQARPGPSIGNLHVECLHDRFPFLG